MRRFEAISLTWVFGIAWLLLTVSLYCVPDEISIQGQLAQSNGDPLSGERAYRARFYGQASGGMQLGTDFNGLVMISGAGRFSIEINPPPEALNQDALYYELAIDSAEPPDGVIDAEDVFVERVQVTSVLFAKVADTAINDLVDDADADPSNELISDVALNGSTLQITDAGGVKSANLAAFRDNRPPVVVLEADRRTVLINSALGETNNTVNFSLSQSYDPEGQALQFGFDPTGTVTGQPAFSSSTTLNYAYTQTGTYLAEGWARDAAGQFAIDKATVEVYSGGVSVLDSEGNVGRYTSLAQINGAPAISYVDFTNIELRYIRAKDANGNSWGASITVDNFGDVGYYSSLLQVNGAPAIAYLDITNGNLVYVRALDANGANWGAPVTIDSPGIVGYFASMAVINGVPAIAYYDLTNHDLKFVRAGDSNGVTWNEPVEVHTAGDVGAYCSLANINGNPAIAYQDSTNAELNYVRATDASGNSWNIPLTLDSDGIVGVSASLAVVNGRPAISYFEFSNADLKYVRAADVNGAAWGAPQPIITTGAVGQETSLKIINGIPAIAFRSLSGDGLSYIQAADADGAVWNAPILVDSSGQVGDYCSLAEINGAPAISYHDLLKGNLKFAH